MIALILICFSPKDLHLRPDSKKIELILLKIYDFANSTKERPDAKVV
jgi:hypothetical protein